MPRPLNCMCGLFQCCSHPHSSPVRAAPDETEDLQDGAELNGSSGPSPPKRARETDLATGRFRPFEVVCEVTRAQADHPAPPREPREHQDSLPQPVDRPRPPLAALALGFSSRPLERSGPNDHQMEAKRSPFRTHHGTALPPPAQARQILPRRSAQPAQTGRNGRRLLRNGSIIADIIMSSSIALQACLGRCVWPPPLWPRG